METTPPKNLFLIPLKFRDKPFLGLAQLSKIFCFYNSLIDLCSALPCRTHSISLFLLRNKLLPHVASKVARTFHLPHSTRLSRTSTSSQPDKNIKLVSRYPGVGPVINLRQQGLLLSRTLEKAVNL